ncbi:transposase, partial [Crocinitomix catalasitica]|nr:transposase [Crocinitomix catalasitica]
MRKFPRYNDILELVVDLNTEKLLMEYLAWMRWGDKPKCIKCGGDKIYDYSRPEIYKCGPCNYQFSVRNGTIFHESKIPIQYWFWALFEFCLEAHSSNIQSQRIITEQKTAWLMDMKLRNVVK